VSGVISTGLLRFTICTEESVYIWGGQSEILPFASSYIRTDGSAVSRSKDNLNLPQAGNVVSNEMTLLCNFDSVSKLGTEQYILGCAGSSGYSVVLRRITGNVDAGVSANATVLTGAGYMSAKIAVVYNGATSINYVDSVFVNSTATSSFTPNASGVVGIGSRDTNGGQQLNGHISKFSTYAQALTAQEITLL
jgi:hypothetical protein